MEEKKYRISYFRTNNSILVCWNKFPEEVIDNIPSGYLTNIQSIDDCGEVAKTTYLILEPVKKYRKGETVVSLAPDISVGLDNY